MTGPPKLNVWSSSNRVKDILFPWFEVSFRAVIHRFCKGPEVEDNPRQVAIMIKPDKSAVLKTRDSSRLPSIKNRQKSVSVS